MEDQELIEKTEQIAMQYFHMKGTDISTREKRIALSQQTKDLVVKFCINTYLKLKAFHGVSL